MSILLTDDEVSILLHENTYLTDGDFARAIQLALIEKMRKILPATYVFPNQMNERRLVELPTAQELESER